MIIDIAFRATAKTRGGEVPGVIVARFHNLDPTKVGWPDQEWDGMNRGEYPDAEPQDVTVLTIEEALEVTDSDGLSPFRERDKLYAPPTGGLK